MKPLKTIMVLILSVVSTYAVTGDIENRYATPHSCPTGMASDGEYLYLADCKSDMIYQIDPEKGAIISEFDAPGFRPQGLAYDGEFLWLVDAEEEVILQIDPKTKVNVKSLWCPAERPAGLAWDGKYLWLADSRADLLRQVSTEDGTTIKKWKSPSKNPTGLAFDGTYLWVADRRDDRIYMVWPETGEVILMFDAPDKYAWGLTFHDGKLYCADYQSDSIYTIKTSDEEFNLAVKPVYEECQYTHQFRNYGPGTVTDLNIYLAVPENSPHQKLLQPLMYESSVNHEIISDQWGQKVARFHFDELPPGGKVEASYTITAELFEHWLLVRPESVGKLKDIPKDIAKEYLVNNTKFAIDSETIQKAVDKAISDETNPYWMMRKIFKYIIDNMYYELAGGWNIAPAVLERGNGSCSEYSFVFIAMCRAAGLPTRYAGSIAQRGDLASEDEVFHRWCEVYLPKVGWVPVDPSGGDQDWPEGQARYIGHVSNRFLITTVGGGGSDYLGWEYNSYETYQSQGTCKIFSEKIGEWSPVDSTQAVSSRIGRDPTECKPK
ncbi:MAG: transglutaminase [candidate division Zixibacteria bacterium]|nr:transglutaminase [candidate division Zixibacteria bacterium]